MHNPGKENSNSKSHKEAESRNQKQKRRADLSSAKENRAFLSTTRIINTNQVPLRLKENAKSGTGRQTPP